MRNKIIFVLVVLGVLGALGSAYVYAVPSKPLPPVFNPAPNPYGQGIYANGIVESYQANGENTNIYAEVPGSIVRIFVTEGQQVTRAQSGSRAHLSAVAQGSVGPALLDAEAIPARVHGAPEKQARAGPGEATISRDGTGRRLPAEGGLN
jgi:HlyD family secretion protein